jgi:hypothetical protein
MNPDPFCSSSDQWSPLSSAAANSQLAGVLGAFLITAIALLFDRNNREGVHTLALFSSAVLILVLDSFVFNLMTGNQASQDGDRRMICTITWTQGAVATGMLATGSVALFGGLGWMLASHAVNKAPTEDPSARRAYSFLADLSGWLTFAAAMAMTLITSETAIDYANFTLGQSANQWATPVIMTVSTAVVVADFCFVYIRTKALRSSLADSTAETSLALRSIKIATVLTVVLAVAGGFVAVSLPRLPDSWLTTPGIPEVTIALVLIFVLPTVVSAAICYSVASTDEPRQLT